MFADIKKISLQSSTALRELGLQGGVGERAYLRIEIGNLFTTIASISGSSLSNLGINSTNTSPTGEETVASAASLGPLLLSLVEAAGIDVDSPLEADEALLDTVATALGIPVAVLQAAGGIGQGVTLRTLLTTGLEAVPLSSLVLEQEVVLAEEVGDPEGKWPTLYGNVAVLEMKHFGTYLQRAISDLLGVVVSAGLGLVSESRDLPLMIRPSVLDAAVSVINEQFLLEHALQVAIQHKDRDTIYVKGPEQARKAMLEFADQLMFDMGGLYPVTMTVPLSEALQATLFIRLFLDQIFVGVVFLLGLLGVMVIYALVIGNVENKAYEYGMLRALGMRQVTVAQLLTLQSLFFSLPGILIGVTIGSLLYIIAADAVSNMANVSIPLVMPLSAWLYGIILGAVMPAVANVVPIRRAMSNTLRDALDVVRVPTAPCIPPWPY